MNRSPLPVVDEPVDPRAELERLIVDCTCEWCGETRWSLEAARSADAPVGRRVTDVERQWCCRKVKSNGYVSTHWRVWRVCWSCRVNGPQFDKWIFPVIANMQPNGLLEQLVQVQPMNQPVPQVLYMDFVVGPEGVRVRPNLPERHPLLRRYAEVGVDPRNYGRMVIGAAEDRADAVALLAATLKPRN